MFAPGGGLTKSHFQLQRFHLDLHGYHPPVRISSHSMMIIDRTWEYYVMPLFHSGT
jgi:hypothetical protein